jgi:hypothetical protein
MGPKYAKGQKVRIISAKNQHFKPRYPQLEEHVSDSGIVIASHWFGISEPYRQYVDLNRGYLTIISTQFN